MFWIAWQDSRGSDYDLWAQRYQSAEAGAPDPPVITSPAHSSEVGTSTPLVQGTAQPFTEIEALVGGSPTTPPTETAADGSGAWSVVLAQGLSNGAYTLTATATDAANQTSDPYDGVGITVLEFTVTFSGDAFRLEPDRGAVRTTTVSISGAGQTVTVKSTNPDKFKLLDGVTEVNELTGVTDQQVIELVGLEPGPGPSQDPWSSVLRAETAGGLLKRKRTSSPRPPASRSTCSTTRSAGATSPSATTSAATPPTPRAASTTRAATSSPPSTPTRWARPRSAWTGAAA